MSKAATRSCPFCAETIKAAALVCRFCGRDLPPPGTPAVPAASPSPAPPHGPPLPAIQNPKSKIQNREVLDLLTSLVDKSLVVYDSQGGEERYRLLETVRQYAGDRLRETGEEEAVRTRHGDWSLALAEEAEPALVGDSQREWLERLEQEHDNLRAALGWCRTSGAQALRRSGVQLPTKSAPSDRSDPSDPERLNARTRERVPAQRPAPSELGLRLGGALWRFWSVRGYYGEGRQHLAGLLALPEAEARTAARARGLYGAGRLAAEQGDYEAARALQEESLALFRELGHARGIALALMGLGLVSHFQGEFERAWALQQESMALFRELGDRWGVAASLSNLGNEAHNRGDTAAARALHEESLTIRRELGDRRGIAQALGSLGLVSYVQGEYDRAWPLLEESLAIFRELGDRNGIASSLNNLGMVARSQGDYRQARALHEEGLETVRELGNQRGIAFVLQNLGCVARAQEEYEEARALLEESLQIFRALGAKPVLALPLNHLAALAFQVREYDRARALRQEILTIALEAGDKPDIAASLEALAALAVAQAHYDRAARLLAAAAALREMIEAPLRPAERAEHERLIAAARAALGEEAFAAAWAEGQALSLEEACAEALHEPTDATQ